MLQRGDISGVRRIGRHRAVIQWRLRALQRAHASSCVSQRSGSSPALRPGGMTGINVTCDSSQPLKSFYCGRPPSGRPQWDASFFRLLSLG